MSDEPCEEYELEQMFLTQEVCHICFRILGLTWQSDRVQDFLAKVSDRIGERITNQYALPFIFYRQVAITIARGVLDDPGLLEADKWGTLLPHYYQVLVEGRVEDEARAIEGSEDA